MKLHRHENNVLAWKGDAALLFVTRLVLSEVYPPDMPIKFLMARQERVISNHSLTNYCKHNGLPYGCNVLEIKIGQMILDNNIKEAKEIIRDIIRNDKFIHKMDDQQLIDGKLNPEFIKKCQIYEKIRLEKKLFFQKANALNINPARKHYLFPHFKRICNFVLACKYSLSIFRGKANHLLPPIIK